MARESVGFLRHSHAVCLAYLSDAAYERVTLLVRGAKAAEADADARPWEVVAWASLAAHAAPELEACAYRAVLCTDPGLSAAEAPLVEQLDGVFGSALAPLRRRLLGAGYRVSALDEVATAVMRSLVHVDAVTLNLPPMKTRRDTVVLCAALYADALRALRGRTGASYARSCMRLAAQRPGPSTRRWAARAAAAAWRRRT